ncbi:MAG: glycosyltransferase, partial [Anaerolineales bacterium]|nr:glycosyltransferase [Anaerolineales bacterium]
MKKKIIWMIDGLGSGGAEHLMPILLSNINSTHFKQRVCTLQVKDGNPVASELEALGIPVDLVHIPNLRHPQNLKKILRYLRKQRPDILHTQLEFSNILGNFASSLLGIPSVSTLHTLNTPQTGERAYWRHQLMLKSLRYFSERIIAVSESTRQHHIQTGGLPPSKIVTIHNGINLHPFAPSPSPSKSLRKSLKIPVASRVLVTVAVLREAKGIQYMLQALPHILAKIPNIIYLVVGDGTYANKLTSLAESLNITEYIRFTGYRNDVAPLLALGEIFILPTLNDAFPTVLLEAMAAKKSLIASNVGGVPEILHD